MRRRIKVADPHIYLVSAAYIHIREEVVNEYHNYANPPLRLPRGDAKRQVRLAGGGESDASIPQQFHHSYMRHPSPKRTAAGIYPTQYTGWPCRELVVGSALVL